MNSRRFETSEITIVISNSFSSATMLFYQNFLPKPMPMFLFITIFIIIFIFIFIPMLYPTPPPNSFLTRLLKLLVPILPTDYRYYRTHAPHDLIMKLPHLNHFCYLLPYRTGILSLNSHCSINSSFNALISPFPIQYVDFVCFSMPLCQTY